MIKSIQQLPEFCSELLKRFDSKQIVLLQGTLGAGKTELVKNFVELLGGENSSSPTYSLIHQYKVSGSRPVYHVDLYRIEGEEDLESVGFWDIFSQDQGLVFVEWPERLEVRELPMDWSKISVTIAKVEQDHLRDYQVSQC